MPQRLLKKLTLLFALLLLGPLYQAALGGEADASARQRGWQFSKRESTGIAPLAQDYAGAIIQVYSARTYSWRGNLAVHTWVATKAVDAPSYVVHQVIGFRERRGLSVRVSENDMPDRYWYGSAPQLLVDIRGVEAETLLPQVLTAVASYPYSDTYTTWPGPNSNTFTAYIGRSVPALKLALPVTAIGKDYLPGGALVAAAPSRTGVQVSLFGLLGFMLSGQEGIEVNILGLAAGVDFLHPALKLPGIGRLGVSVDKSKAERAAEVGSH